MRSPQCLHFPNRFEWSPLWILPKFSAIPSFVLPKIKWSPLKSSVAPPPPTFLRVSDLSLFACCFCFLIARAIIECTLGHIQGQLYKWGLYLTIILDCSWGHWATKPDSRFITKSIGFDFPWIYGFNFAMIQTIKYNGRILNVKPNAWTVQGRYSIIFKRLVTDRQHTCNSVDKWVSIACLASSVTSLYPQLTKFLSLSSLAFYETLLPSLSFANSDLRYVHFYSKCNSEEPQQNSITTWNSYSWYLRKIIKSLNYEDKSWQVKVWKVLI